jgi:hypothetical protein
MTGGSRREPAQSAYAPSTNRQDSERHFAPPHSVTATERTECLTMSYLSLIVNLYVEQCCGPPRPRCGVNQPLRWRLSLHLP